MPFSLRRDGDPLERTFAPFIESRLPNYVRLWETFIGNDGNSQLPGQSKLASDVATLRSETAHYTYTALESAVAAYRIQETSLVVIPPLLEAGAVETLLDATTSLVAFFAHIGRIKDCAGHLASEWQDAELWQPMSEFYQRRNNILHQAKVPTAIIDGLLAAVPPRGIDSDSTKWGKGSRWHSTLTSPIPLVELFTTTLDELLPLLDAMFARLAANHLYSRLSVVVALLKTLPGPALPSGTSSAGPVILMPPSASLVVSGDRVAAPGEGKN